MPNIIALAGPNGAGKSTVGPPLLKELLGVSSFVNADVIAQGLSAYEPERAALAAGRIMLTRLKQLARAGEDFAFETTLAGRAYAPWIAELRDRGYVYHLVFLSLPSPEFAIQRVEDRVRRGGHSIPPETVHRRYHAGLRNFFALYRPLATTWRFYDNSRPPPPRLIASGQTAQTRQILDETSWNAFETSYGDDIRES